MSFHKNILFGFFVIHLKSSKLLSQPHYTLGQEILIQRAKFLEPIGNSVTKNLQAK